MDIAEKREDCLSRLWRNGWIERLSKEDTLNGKDSFFCTIKTKVIFELFMELLKF